MEILFTLNNYIQYVYYFIGAILFVLLLKLLKELSVLGKTLQVINDGAVCINEQTDEIKTKIEKIQYTLDHSVPFFAFLFFILLVLISSIQDYRNTRYRKRNIVKSSYKEYGNLKRRFHYRPSAGAKKELLSAIMTKRG